MLFAIAPVNFPAGVSVASTFCFACVPQKRQFEEMNNLRAELDALRIAASLNRLRLPLEPIGITVENSVLRLRA